MERRALSPVQEQILGDLAAPLHSRRTVPQVRARPLGVNLGVRADGLGRFAINPFAQPRIHQRPLQPHLFLQ